MCWKKKRKSCESICSAKTTVNIVPLSITLGSLSSLKLLMYLKKKN